MDGGLFRFKRFSVRHDKCAMKVGTDSVLLGAWAYVDNCRRIIDIGCGSGVISLMVAQRNEAALVCGVELETAAALQAEENVRSSVFADRIAIHEGDIAAFCGQFDCIVCNPPFYVENTVSPGMGRAMARSAVTLTYDKLWNAVTRLSADGAYCNVILPYEHLRRFSVRAVSHGFSVRRLCLVHTREDKPPKRAMVTYYNGKAVAEECSRLVLQKEDGARTEEYSRLTEDFYLSAT